jgi:hypothetical protein
MRRSIITASAILLIMAIAMIAASSGYVVILKSGHRIRAKEPLRIEGPNAIIMLATGTEVSYPVSAIDLVATERYNQLGLGDAITIDEFDKLNKPAPTATPSVSLGSVAQISSGVDDATLGTTAPPTPTPTPGITLQSARYHDPRVDQAFSQILDDRKLYQYRTSVGTQPNFFFVQTVTDTQREVFKALKVICEAYAIIHELHPEIAPASLELEMVTLSNKPAGTFRISTEQARDVATGVIGVEEFYVRNVIF